jgi:RNA polymerase sigma-70 factor (ECF subfamily)
VVTDEAMERLAERPARSAPARAVSIEHALVLRAKRGDPRAFRMIFDRHSPSVRRFLLDLLRDASAADEATQETFVRAYRALPKLREDAKLQSWILGIARNVFYERLRARKRRGHDAELTDAVIGQISVGTAPTPEDALLRREADALLGRALAEIPAERRAALLLRIDHGLGYQEIAAAMGWTAAKVKNEIHRGRLQLRAQLQHYLGGKA